MKHKNAALVKALILFLFLFLWVWGMCSILGAKLGIYSVPYHSIYAVSCIDLSGRMESYLTPTVAGLQKYETR
jgi:hypothetical protein